MQLTLNIDTSNEKAIALLNYMRTLEFVSFEEPTALSEIQRQAIDIGIEAVVQGKVQSHEEVMDETRERYPNLFQ